MHLHTAIAGVLASAFALTAHAYDAYDWPVHYLFSNGYDLGVSGNYAGDYNRFSRVDDLTSTQRSTLDEARGARREEFNVYAKKAGVFDATWGWDFWNKSYLDVFIRFETRAFLGADYGKLRLGYSKTYVGFEGATSSRNDSFLETAMAEQALYEGRRLGIDWEFERPQFRFDVGTYAGQDLQGDNDGTTINARFAWTPMKAPGNVLHLGIAASEENPDAGINGKGQRAFPATRMRARPDAFLTTTRFVDSGTIANVDHIDRTGVEALWIHGPWSVQGEYLNQGVHRFDGKPTVSGSGGYVFCSWVVSGESRPYANGNVGNLKPSGDRGALELLVRYDNIDLNDTRANIRGGKEHNWTFGANGYLLTHLRLQANYVLAHEQGNRAFNHGKPVGPRVFAVRAQLYF